MLPHILPGIIMWMLVKQNGIKMHGAFGKQNLANGKAV
jgi:hypothetical protein